MAHHFTSRLEPTCLLLGGPRLMAAAGLGLGLWALPAHAHIELISPPARYGPDMQKSGPCGDPDNPAGEGQATVYQPGETITVEFDEFIDHQSHFRIAVDVSGTDNYTSPMAFDDLYNSPEVILDDILDMQAGGLHSVEVTLPEEPCDPCSLQLIQVMTDDGVWGPGEDDLYFQCADIVIDPAGGSGDPTGGDSASGGDTTGGQPGDTGGGTPDDDGASTNTDTTGTGGIDPGSEDSGGTADAASDEDGGCSCRTDGRSTSAAPWLLLVLLAPRRPRR